MPNVTDTSSEMKHCNTRFVQKVYTYTHTLPWKSQTTGLDYSVRQSASFSARGLWFLFANSAKDAPPVRGRGLGRIHEGFIKTLWLCKLIAHDVLLESWNLLQC